MATFNTKKEMIEKVAEKRSISKVKAKEMVEDILEVVEELIMDETHDGLDIYGFGKIEIVEVPEKIGRNPKTGESITIPKHYKPKAKLSKRIKDMIRE